jgi:hypothetical protein
MRYGSHRVGELLRVPAFRARPPLGGCSGACGGVGTDTSGSAPGRQAVHAGRDTRHPRDRRAKCDSIPRLARAEEYQRGSALHDRRGVAGPQGRTVQGHRRAQPRRCRRPAAPHRRRPTGGLPDPRRAASASAYRVGLRDRGDADTGARARRGVCRFSTPGGSVRPTVFRVFAIGGSPKSTGRLLTVPTPEHRSRTPNRRPRVGARGNELVAIYRIRVGRLRPDHHPGCSERPDPAVSRPFVLRVRCSAGGLPVRSTFASAHHSNPPMGEGID